MFNKIILFIFLISGIEYQDSKIQLEQTLSKEDSQTNTHKESSKPGKSRSTKSKPRRSPYPTTTTPISGEFSPESNYVQSQTGVNDSTVAGHLGQTNDSSGMQWPPVGTVGEKEEEYSGPPTPDSEDINSYSALWYHNSYPHQVYSDAWSMYAYGNMAQKYYGGVVGTHNGYGFADDKCYPKETEDTNPMNLYANYYGQCNNSLYINDYKNSQSPNTGTDLSSKRQSECGSVGSEYHYEPCAQASRKSRNNTEHYPHQENDGSPPLLPAIQPRVKNESVPVLKSIHPKRKTTCTNPLLTLDKISKQADTVTGLSKSCRQTTSHQSVIMKNQSDCCKQYQNDSEFVNSQYHNHSSISSVINGQVDSHTAVNNNRQYNHSNRASALNGHTEPSQVIDGKKYVDESLENMIYYSDCSNSPKDSDHVFSQNHSQLHIDSHDINAAVVSQDLSSYDTFQSCSRGKYSQNSSMTDNCTHYPTVPQAGYTSVIVDTQQYQLTNGFVH